MDRALLIALAAAALLLLALAFALGVAWTGRRALRQELLASRRDVAALRDRLEELGRRLDGVPGSPDERGEHTATETVSPGQYLITTLPAGASRPDLAAGQDEHPPGLPASVFVSVALGESLVRVVSFGHGVRRAMSAENRNRLRFEMQREVKRARRQRRRDLKEARRHLRTDRRTGLTEDVA
jgi:hypothetical protein